MVMQAGLGRLCRSRLKWADFGLTKDPESDGSYRFKLVYHRAWALTMLGEEAAEALNCLSIEVCEVE